jgi:hypothetical protein
MNESKAKHDALTRIARTWGVWMPLVIVTGLVGYYLPEHAYIILLLLGTGLAVRGIKGLCTYLRARNWKKAPGVLNSVKQESILEPNRGSPTHYVIPVVKYEYDVHGRQYTGELVSFETENVRTAEGESDPAWKHWTPGSRIDVFYNPLDPTQSVLFPNWTSERLQHQLALIIGGGLVIGVGVLTAFLNG